MMMYPLFHLATFSLKDRALSLVRDVDIGDTVLCIADATQYMRHAIVIILLFMIIMNNYYYTSSVLIRCGM